MMSKTIYQEHGYKNRHDYLFQLARDYCVPYDVVRNLANFLGVDEDFGKLIQTLESLED